MWQRSLKWRFLSLEFKTFRQYHAWFKNLRYWICTESEEPHHAIFPKLPTLFLICVSDWNAYPEIPKKVMIHDWTLTIYCFGDFKKLKWRFCKIDEVHELKDRDYEKQIELRLWLVNLYFSDETWFHLNGYANYQYGALKSSHSLLTSVAWS